MEETLNLLADVHFPGSVANDLQPYVDLNRSRYRPPGGTARIAKEIACSRKISWAIRQFEPYKSAGDGNIFPALLQQGIDIILPLLVELYKACLTFGYVPMTWRTAKVTFIPKPGKASYLDAKSFRPICLSSFLLKGLERLIDRFIRDLVLPTKPLHEGQHAYRTGRSTETALHEIVSKIEDTLEDRHYGLAVFFDIEGAFDKAAVSAMEKALRRKQTHASVIKFISALLRSRVVITTMGGCRVSRLVTRGCPQGGVLSPLLWSLVVDELLMTIDRIDNNNLHVQFYADDGTFYIRGTSLARICNAMQTPLNKLESWCKKNGLSVNPTKTEMVLFTRKRSRNGFRSPLLGGVQLSLSTSVKYLGVYLDSKLLWNLHIEEKTRKAQIVLFQLKRTVGATWGLKPKVTMWFYSTIVKPMFLYACVVWWPGAVKRTGITRLDQLQRLAVRLVSSCFSTTPTRALETLINVRPLHIATQEQALHCWSRISRFGFHFREIGHGCIQNIARENGVVRIKEDFCAKRYYFEQSYAVSLADHGDFNPENRNAIVCYTDGSRFEGLKKSGYGIYIQDTDTRLCRPLGRYSTVFQTEVIAIKEAASELTSHRVRNCAVDILSDSQAALLALSSNCITSSLVGEGKTELNKLGANNTVTLRWIRGHAGHQGNEIADELARAGSLLPFFGPEPAVGVSTAWIRSEIKHVSIQLHIQLWQGITTCRQSKALGLAIDAKRSEDLLRLSRRHIRAITCLLTGHGGFRKHLHRLGLAASAICHLCWHDEDTAEHFLCRCEKLNYLRLAVFGFAEMHALDISTMSLSKLCTFLKRSGRSAELTGLDL